MENLNDDHTSPEESLEESGEEIKKDIEGLWGSTTKFLSELLDIRGNTDQEATKKAIIADIPFKGHTSWILICSIFIASIGLNANATAVVIGAMLISPLMGPILGMGMALAINDLDMMRRSVNNFAVMVVLSVLTAYLFFALFPLRDESSELLARTAPDIRDVLIAFFGGLALVIARTKKGTIASVIFGVAIATALIPPLCTVGFGLAIGNLQYAWGALYLFIINTIFIGLATFMIIKLLRFPMVRYADSKFRRRVSRVVSVVALAVMIPASITFYDVFQESRFKKQANEFIRNEIASYQLPIGGRFLDDFTDVNYNHGDHPYIELVFMGKSIPDNVIANWKLKKEAYPKLAECDLKIDQASENEDLDQFKYINELYETQKGQLLGKDEQIQLLQGELMRLKKINNRQIPFQDISAEVKANYPNLVSISYANEVISNFSKLDTITMFEVKWKAGIKSNQIENESRKLQDWLKIRLKDSTVQLSPTYH